MTAGTASSAGTANSARTAIVGMAGRFPGAPGIDALWSMLASGTEAVRRFSDDELRAAGVPESRIGEPDHLPYGADLPGIEDFDAEFFGITPAEARLIDPQHRIFLECVWAALEDAGAPPSLHGGRTGVFASASLSSYLLHNVLRSADHRDAAFTYPVLLGNDKDFLPTRVSYALNLRGPSVAVQSACSSSLVAVDQACAALRSGRCDVAVAGGVSVFTPQTVGYRYQAGGTFSRDGHCRPFDAAASGMVRGSGCGVVVLKRLDDALADRDHVYAVVAGTAVNNDGSAKAGYSAPGAAGQDEVVRMCLETSGVPASQVGYVEAHGTGTYLGDPIEIAALQQAYEGSGDPPGECALGSIKANIGHLDAAAGVAGLIKTVLVLHHQTVPPQANFSEPNPELRLAETPFVVHTRAVKPSRRIEAAAVTSLGIGGTNAHCVLERAPAPHRPDRNGPGGGGFEGGGSVGRGFVGEGSGDGGSGGGGEYVLLLSAPDAERLRDAAGDLLDHLARDPRTRLDDLAFTLAHGRSPLAHRTAVTAADVDQAIAGLRDVREGRFEELGAYGERGAYGDAHLDTGRIGDVREAHKTRLPGTRLRRVRHWIEPEPEPEPGPAGVPPTDSSTGRKATGTEPTDGEATGREPVATEPAEDAVAVATRLFRDHLGIDSAGPDDDYYALGGDSLHAISLVEALRERLGGELTPERFTGLGTPRQVAHWLTAAHPDGGEPAEAPAGTGGGTEAGTEDVAGADTLTLIKEGRPDRTSTDRPVFLIHPSGGSVSFAHALAAHSRDPSPLYGIAYPVALSASLTTVPAMARRYVRLIRRARPHGPYRIGGYSLGGAVALEAARLLTGEGEQVERVLMWDTLPPRPGERARSEREFLDLYPPLLRLMFKLPSPPPDSMPSPRTVDEAIESVRPPGWPDAVVRELRTMYEVWRVCDRALAEYRPEPYDGPVHLFAAEQPLPEGPLTALTDVGPGGGTSTAEGWRGVLTGELRSTTVPGHHFDMFDAARLPVLAEAYDRALRPEAARTDGGGGGVGGGVAGAVAGAGAGAGASTAVPATPVEPARPGGGDGRDGERRRVALLFPGQGSQFEGMGSELLARYPESAAEADEVLGYRVADVCAGDPRRPLSDTAYTQPALYVVCALALRRWREEQAEAGAAGARPVVALGHSLGEYNALEAAGVFSFADGLRLVAERGAAMAKIGGGGMIAVSGLTDEELRALLDAQGEPTRLDLAAVNAPRMHTLAGPDGALDAMSAVLLRNGARSVRRLDVGGPFHSRWMSPAAREFRTVLDSSGTQWAAPAFPVVANTTARPHSAERVREELVAQIDHPVLWSRSVEHVIAEHDDPEFHEIGGRRVLTPMVTRIRNALKGAARHG